MVSFEPIIAVCTGATMTFLFLSQVSDVSNVFVRLIFSVVGGLIAPFAKDIVTALSGIGSRK